MNQFIGDVLFIVKGGMLTFELALGGLFLGLVMGLFFAIMHYNGFLVFVINAFVSVVRGTPLILQLSFFYFVVPTMLNIRLDFLTVGILSFGLNSSAYVTEIFRAGIGSIDKGQFEAADSLRIPTLHKWCGVILPQVLKNIFPALVNEIISLLKETAIISVIGGMDIMRRAQVLAASQFTYFMPLTVAAVCYYCLIIIIEYIAKKIESKNA